jgi:AraC-like DNA-binding protein
MDDERCSRQASRKPAWPPIAFCRSLATLGDATNGEQRYLAYFQPSARPFFLFSAFHFPAGTLTAAHNHPCVALHGCLEGPLFLVTGAGEHKLDTGVFYLLAPGIRHQCQNDGPGTAALMSFLIDTARPGPWPALSGLGDCCRELQRLVQGVHRFHVAEDAELQQAFWQLADQLMAEPPHRPVTTTGLLCTLTGLALERLRPGPATTTAQSVIARQMQRVLVACMGGQLSIKEVASRVGLSPTRAKQVFRATYGCGIMAYFNQLKIRQAKRLLCDPSLTVDQVSKKLGFSTASYFSRVFHQHTGRSPLAFRNGSIEREEGCA